MEIPLTGVDGKGPVSHPPPPEESSTERLHKVSDAATTTQGKAEHATWTQPMVMATEK